MAGTAPVRVASYKVRTAAFPYSQWIEFRKAFKAKRSTRDTGGPPWERIDGPSFTLWLSEVRLLDTRTVPATWEIRLESLAPLNPAGQQRWAEACEGIEQFVRASDLEPTDAPDGELPAAADCGGHLAVSSFIAL